MVGFSAVEPGTDLPGTPVSCSACTTPCSAACRRPGGPGRSSPARGRASWRSGWTPTGRTPATRCREEIERRRRGSPLSLVIGELRQVLSGVADASRFLMVVTDADGVILWREGLTSVRVQADRLGFGEGAVWTETTVGTNAIGTALAEQAPVQLFSAEHFEQQQHLVLHRGTGPRPSHRRAARHRRRQRSGLSLHPAITALVETAVRLAESLLWRHHQERLERLRTSVEHVLSGVRGPVLLVDDHGWVAHHSGIAVRDRIGVPRADRALAVPGMGLCLPERLADGWLVRPPGGGHALTARLDLTSRPVLEVRAEGDPTDDLPQPAAREILDLLAGAGPAGLTASDLSRTLFGDADHAVTVRAEVSRLRRAIGALVETNPYRLADDVELTVVRSPTTET